MISSVNSQSSIMKYGPESCDFQFKAKDPVSSLTHFIGCIMSIFFTPVLLIRASNSGAELKDMVALSIFMLSMIMLYGASASYHGFMLTGKAALRLKRLDHMMIFVLIAGTYTPVCVCAMGRQGLILLSFVWGLAIIGMVFKFLWVGCPKWVSSVVYISMGWLVIFAMPALIRSVSGFAISWLCTGGVIYTAGGIIYALKLVKLNSRNSLWGSHEIFHLFVMGGSICQYISIFSLFS